MFRKLEKCKTTKYRAKIAKSGLTLNVPLANRMMEMGFRYVEVLYKKEKDKFLLVLKKAKPDEPDAWKIGYKKTSGKNVYGYMWIKRLYRIIGEKDITTSRIELTDDAVTLEFPLEE